jgi:hypothetical protein
MSVRRIAVGRLFLSAGALATLAGCAATPLGPTVQVMPGRGKAFDTFQSDQAGCKGYAANQVKGQADSANQRAVGAALLTTVLSAGLGAAIGGAAGDAGAGAAIGAAAGAGGGTAYGAGNSANDQMNIQQQYDNAFSQCMYAKGDLVPGFAPNGAVASIRGPAAAPDPLVQSTQSELIRLGYLKSPADGYIGEKTRTAIAVFEQSNSLPADGSASPQLLARLQSTAAGGSSATASSSGWVAPASSRSATPAAAKDWVGPAGSPSATPASATSGGWVTPKTQ